MPSNFASAKPANAAFATSWESLHNKLYYHGDLTFELLRSTITHYKSL